MGVLERLVHVSGRRAVRLRSGAATAESRYMRKPSWSSGFCAWLVRAGGVGGRIAAVRAPWEQVASIARLPILELMRHSLAGLWG